MRHSARQPSLPPPRLVYTEKNKPSKRSRAKGREELVRHLEGERTNALENVGVKDIGEAGKGYTDGGVGSLISEHPASTAVASRCAVCF